jgi:predicted TPR repeat methyltransferase
VTSATAAAPAEPSTAVPSNPRELALREAMQAHSRGALEVAAARYGEWLAVAPEDADALHLLGVLRAQQGRPLEAAGLIGQAIDKRPGESMFHNNLGNVRAEQGRLAEAEASYRQALGLDGTRLDAANNLAVVLSRSGQHDEAQALFGELLAAAPGFVDARLNFAQHCFRGGDYGAAVELCAQGLIVDPRSNPMRRLLGVAYTMLGRDDLAVALYRRWLEEEPGNPVPQHHLAACLGSEVPARASDAYVRQVFDNFAGSFDTRLAELDYRAPALVAAWLEAEAAGRSPAWRILDAGCGTGLIGPRLRAHAAWLEGVDLSPGMLQKAAQRGLYDALHEAELVAWLVQRRGEPYDAIVCADTLCYFGPLESFAQAAASALVAGGRLVATVEAHPPQPAGAAAEAPHRLHGHGRYSHARSHVEAALAAAGFCDIRLQPVELRQEAGEPVAGWLIGARTRAAA